MDRCGEWWLAAAPAGLRGLHRLHGKGKIAAYEVWNEQNYAVETGGAVNLDDPAAPYLPVLKAGYQTPKAVDPKITVVFGGMTPTSTVNVGIAIDEVQYLQKMYQR